MLPRFHELWPYVSIQLVDTSSEVMEQMVFDGELDLYIGIKYTADPHLEILPLLDDNLFLVVSDSLMVKQLGEECGTVKRQSAGGVKLKEFKDFPFLLPSRRCVCAKWWTNVFWMPDSCRRCFWNPALRSF